jgi:quercetin dioxygenase-like cupin family protein
MSEPPKGPIVWSDLTSIALPTRELAVYDRPIGMRLLYEDPGSGAEHYLVRYPAGMTAQWHRHSAGHTIVVIEGRLHVNDEIIGPRSYCHYGPNVPMWHAPAADEACLFLIMFDGPSDVAAIPRDHE